MGYASSAQERRGPPDATSIWCWVNADSVDNAGAVGTAYDRSGNGRDWTQGTAGNKPTVAADARFGGAKAIVFDGANDRLLGPSMAALTASDVFISVVVDADPPGAVAQSGFWHLGTSGLDSHFPLTDSSIYDDGGSTTRKAIGNPGPSLTSARTYNVFSASGDFGAYLDGASLFSTATNTPGYTASPKLGTGTSSAQFLDGAVRDFVIYSSKRTTAQRAAITAWLQRRRNA